MVEIIKVGKNLFPAKYKTVCKRCECEFTYEKNNIKWDGCKLENGFTGYFGYVTCPWCKQTVFHSLDV